MSQQVKVFKSLDLRETAFINAQAPGVTRTRTSGALIYLGDSSNYITGSGAATNFIQAYFKASSATGDHRGMYLRLQMTTAAATGEALRAFTNVQNVAGGTAHGGHISLSFGTTGSLTGLGVAMRATLHIPNQNWGSSGGTCAAVQAEIWSDGTASDPVGMTTLSCFRVVNGGNATGLLDVDTDAYLFDFAGWSSASGTTNMVSSTSLAELPASSIGFRVRFNSNVYYIPAVIAAQWN